jgi:hypothetical protein
VIDLSRMLAVLHAQHVEFAMIGGMAARVHGSARVTPDVDLVYSRTDANIVRLVKSMASINPYPRGAPAKLPFAWTTDTVKAGLNFSLQTTLGDVDLLGAVVGGGRYEDLVGHCVTEKLFGAPTMVVSLPWLIRLKRAAGQPRDFEAIAELELLQELAALP